MKLETIVPKVLFQIKCVKTQTVLPQGYADKQEAKKGRRSMNPKNKEGLEILDYVVTLGHDHDRYMNGHDILA